MENSSIAVRLRKLCERHPITGNKTSYTTLAEHLGVKNQSVSQWARGETTPDTKSIAPIAIYFGVSCDYLLGIDDAPTHAASDICKITPLAPESAEVLMREKKITKSMKDWREAFADLKDVENREALQRQGETELRYKALNHIIANCNYLLTLIGMYLFEEFPDIDNVTGKNYGITATCPGESIRDSIPSTIAKTLVLYREKLIENGGDLPLTLVLDEMLKEQNEQKT